MTLTSQASPRLTIVIPTLNRAYCVGRAIESVLSQTSTDFEVLVSDNGSVDNTQEVLARYTDPRLRKFHFDTTMSAGKHGNFLIDESRGEFFLGLSDDDFLEDTFVERVLDLFDRQPQVRFVYTGCNRHYGNVVAECLVGPEVEDGMRFIEQHYANTRNVCWCACVTRVADLRRIGPLPEDVLFGDMFFWTTIALEGDVGCVPAPLANYTFLTDNLSSGTPVPVWSHHVLKIALHALHLFSNRCHDTLRNNRLEKAMRRYHAISTTNQFVWTSIRGTKRILLLRWFLQIAGETRLRPRLFAQILLSVILPKFLLRVGIQRQTKKIQVSNAKVNNIWRNHLPFW
jgi:glycosyltransferase involved in cell wall biosynthesis